ncbi:BnaA06g24130D [Brassica napus]|uniref:BnaA06g24130D protein n=1 Tax=Brassica napus TaxID=3708 RepID=A0A078F5X8_BRANA|nr:BnaA06g24130D [Brassica napus]
MGSSDEMPVVLITGCSKGGIGYALAREFSANGCRVVATSQSQSTMSDLEKDPKFFVQELDVQSEQSVSKAVSEVIDKYGQIDVLVNNAGVQCIGPLAEIPIQAMENTFNTNVFSKDDSSCCTPHASKRKGKIVNIGSISIMAPGPWSGVYTASKAALHALTDTLRLLELRPFGIDVINIVPGAETIQTLSRIYPSKGVFVAKHKTNTCRDICERDGRLSTVMAIMHHMPVFVKDFLLTRSFMKMGAKTEK